MIRTLPFALELALLVFCLVDCIHTDSWRVRNLGKGTWVVLIVILPLVGGIAWLVAGRPERHQQREGGRYSHRTGFPEDERPRRTSTTDHDASLAAELARVDAEFDEAVRRSKARSEGAPPPAE